MKSNKKAFTIVELVIVIAVIAILAAVLIPTFSNLIKRSKVSADQQLIRNLNSALKADLKDHNTMTDALAAAEEFGYNVSKINKSATDNEILWDSKNDVFCYFESDKNDITYIPETTLKVAKENVKDVDYWVIAKAPSDKYSTYLYNAELTAIDNLTTGLDVGNETITSIRYTGGTSAQTVTIVTNGGTLTIEAKDDNVIHYGYADSVNVIDVASASYHEKGTVKFLEVAAGHVVLEATAKVTAFHFTATGEDDAAKFENADGKKISVDLSNVPAENLPSFSRDAVTIAQNGTYVAEVKTDKTEFIWLFGYGIKEQMVATTNEGAIAENGVLNVGITAGAEDGSVAEQIANPAKRNSQGQLVASDGETVVDISEAVVEELPSKEMIEAAAILFEGGSGTQDDPYLIPTFEAFLNVDAVSKGSETLYYRVINDLEAYDTTSWANGYLYEDPATYVIDMGGHSLTVKDSAIFGYAVNFELYNGKIEFIGGGSVIGYACYQDMSSYNINFHDLVLSGTAENSASHYGPLVSYAFGLNTGNSVFSASNVINNMTIKNNNSTGYSGGLFGYVQGSKVSSSITNCTFNGSIVSAHAGAFLNPCSFPNAAAVVSENNTLNGQLLASETAIAFGCNSNLTGGTQALNNLQATVSKGPAAALTVLTASSNLISVDDNNQVILNKEDSASTYRIAIVFMVNNKTNGTGGYPRYITVDIDQFADESKQTGIYKYNIVQDSADLSSGKTVVAEGSGGKIWLEGTTYHIYFPEYELSNNKATIWAYAYNSNGDMTAYQSIPYSY